MKRIILLILVASALMTSTAVADTPTLPYTSVITSNTLVQVYLKLAVQFWHGEYPALIPPCGPEQVFIAPMVAGLSVNGITLPAQDVWAETYLGTCNIYLSSTVASFLPNLNSIQQWEACIVIAHEYGHTLGLPDETAIPMMSQNWKRRDDPLCIQYIWGWRWTTHTDREWLAEHGLAHRHAVGIAP